MCACVCVCGCVEGGEDRVTNKYDYIMKVEERLTNMHWEAERGTKRR